MSTKKYIKLPAFLLAALLVLIFAESFFTVKYFTKTDNKDVVVNLVPVKMQKDSVDMPRLQEDLKRVGAASQQLHNFLTSKNIADQEFSSLRSDSLTSAVYLAKQASRYSSYLAQMQLKLSQVPLGIPTEGYISSNFGNRKNPIPVKVVPKPEVKPAEQTFETKIVEEKDSAGNVIKKTEVKVPVKNPDTKNIASENNPPAEADQIQFHKGLDIAVAYGTDVKSAAEGTVIFAGEKSGYGNCIIISHGNGLDTLYGHLSQILVAQNDHVKVGQVIAKSGNTGRSTGPHLHYEVHKDGTPVNPKLFLNL